MYLKKNPNIFLIFGYVEDKNTPCEINLNI